MKQISHWAAAHVWPSRILLVGGKMLLAVLALAAGVMLTGAGIALPEMLFWLAAGSAAIAAMLYPQRGNYKYKLQFARRKLCDFTLAMCSFVMILGWAGEAPLPRTGNPAHAATTTSEPAVGQSGTGHQQSRVGKLFHRAGEKAQRFFQRLRDDFKGLALGWQIALIVLTVVLALALGVLVAALACGIACNGAEALAIVVAILGFGGVITGGFFAIRSIIRHGKHYKGGGRGRD